VTPPPPFALKKEILFDQQNKSRSRKVDKGEKKNPTKTKENKNSA
jgi:hypothetical protein